MTNPKISVIVPVYNAEKYLHRCIDSILAQTFTDFELLLINDGSKDNSGKICDEYAAKDSRVRVFHKENGGVTIARALGVSLSKGNYISFVDSDDFLLNRGLESLVEAMSNEVDIVIGAYERMKEIISINGDSTISALEYQNFVLSSSWHPWGKLYRKELFRNKVFDIPREIVHGEDAVMNIRVAFNCDKKIRFISSPIYHYYINDDGCCSTFNMNFLYLVKWYNQIHKSIPDDRVKDFLEDLIILRLKYRNYILEYYIKNNIWRKHEFNRRLLQDIETCNFKLKASDKLLLACHNPISCFLYNMVINIYHNIFIIRNR